MKIIWREEDNLCVRVHRTYLRVPDRTYDLVVPACVRTGGGGVVTGLGDKRQRRDGGSI